MSLSSTEIQAIAREVAKELALVLRSNEGETSSELTAKGVAALLGLSVPTIERLTAKGEIPSYKVGRSRRYNRDAVLKAAQETAVCQN